MSFISLLTGSYKKTPAKLGVSTETLPHEEGFAAHYAKHIRPQIRKFETARRAALNTASQRLWFSLPFAFIGIVIGIFIVKNAEEGRPFWGIAIPLIIIALLCAWVHSAIDDYQQSIKRVIFPKIISFFGEFKYTPECENMVPALKKSSIIPSHYDIEKSEDKITGSYNNVRIKSFETELIDERRDLRGRSYSVTVFKGLLITFTMNKAFSGKTIVRKRSGLSGGSYQLEQVKLEDPRFDKMFIVHSSDQVEARYLLTASFMERLLQLTTLLKSTEIECSFYDNQLLLKIPVSKNMFEPGSVYIAEDFTDDAKSLLQEMQILFDIIETLKLDQNIGM